MMTVKTIRKQISGYILQVLFLTIVTTCNAFAASGDINWGGWEFSYNTDNSVGLELNNVQFKERKILHRASFPVMRVEYDNDACGPYADILWSQTFLPIDVSPPLDSCNGDSLCARTYQKDGNELLEIGVNAKLGEYEIYQSYIFSPDGYFDSFVFSRGLQCDTDHRHHAHWMFDFDIDGKDDDQILKNSGDLQISEFNDLKTDTSYWTIRDAETGLRVELIPGADDGFTDDFSQWDAVIRRWKAAETNLWLWGARGELGNFFNDSESIDREDLVFWYISHLDHKALEGSVKWHASGPRIRVINP